MAAAGEADESYWNENVFDFEEDLLCEADVVEIGYCLGIPVFQGRGRGVHGLDKETSVHVAADGDIL